MKTKTNISVQDNTGARVISDMIVGEYNGFRSGDILDANATQQLIIDTGAPDAYKKPANGIPASDMTASVQQSLSNADTAIQQPSTPGTSGQILLLDSEGNPAWITPTAGTAPDTEMSDSSTNAVQNKTIKQYIDEEISEVESLQEDTDDELDALTTAFYEELSKDPDKKYGQPKILFGAGAPAESIVPENWIQFLDGGYNWIGKPAFIGLLYLDTSVNIGGLYIGYKIGGWGSQAQAQELEWRQIVG